MYMYTLRNNALSNCLLSILEKLPPQESPAVSTNITETEQTSSSMAEIPRGPLHAIMPPSWNVHNFPIQDYKPGELATLLGAQNEAELERLRMQLNTRPHHPSPMYDNHGSDKKEIVEPLKVTSEDTSQTNISSDHNVNFDGVLLVRSLIKREQAERLRNANHPQPQLQPDAVVHDSNTTSTRKNQLQPDAVVHDSSTTSTRKKQSAVSISNLEESSIKENTIKPDKQTESTEDRHDVDLSHFSQSHHLNHTNIQMVKDIIEQEKIERGSFLSTYDQNQSKMDISSTVDPRSKAVDQSNITQRSLDAQETEYNADWD